MKATYNSEFGGASIIELNFNPEKKADKQKAEKIGQILVDGFGYEWIHEEDDIMTVGINNQTISEMREDYNSAKAELKSREVAE